MYSKISAGWQSRALHIASKVEKRTAFAFPDFSMERFAVVIPIISASSLLRILRFASITSKLITIGISYTVNSFSCWSLFPSLKISANTKLMIANSNGVKLIEVWLKPPCPK